MNAVGDLARVVVPTKPNQGLQPSSKSPRRQCNSKVSIIKVSLDSQTPKLRKSFDHINDDDDDDDDGTNRIAGCTIMNTREISNVQNFNLITPLSSPLSCRLRESILNSPLVLQDDVSSHNSNTLKDFTGTSLPRMSGKSAKYREGRSSVMPLQSSISDNRSMSQTKISDNVLFDVKQATKFSATVEDLLEYLTIAAADPNSSNASFLHVTPRYNVELVNRSNFYDLVVLERPGYPASGFVWQRGDSQDKDKILKANQLMQLSLDGLLLSNDADNNILDGKGCSLVVGGDLIPLAVFFKERNLLNQLRELKFFGLYKEMKCFGAWYKCIRRRKFNQKINALNSSTFFLNDCLVRSVQRILSSIHRIEVETDLFYYHQQGSVNIVLYFELQTRYFQYTTNTLADKVQSLNKFLLDQYELSLKLAYADSSIDYSTLTLAEKKSIQRHKNIMQQKFHALCVMAQYRLEQAIATIVKAFWTRLKLFVKGVREVNKAGIQEQIGYWSLSNASSDVPVATASNAYMSKEEIMKGCYLSLDVGIFDRQELIDINYVVSNLNCVGDLKIKITPSRSHLFDKLKEFYDSLGAFMLSLPNLSDELEDIRDKPSSLDHTAGITVASNCYFNILRSKPVFSTQGGMLDACYLRKVVAEGFDDAVAVSGPLKRILQDKLFIISSMSADRLTAMASSAVTVEMKRVQESHDSSDDAGDVMNREIDNLYAFQHSVESLDAIDASLCVFPNLRCVSGMVVSFATAAAQINEIRSSQHDQIMSKLPLAFISRTNQHTDYIRQVIKEFQSNTTVMQDKVNAYKVTHPATSLDIDYAVAFLSKLIQFDAVKSLYACERNISDQLYDLVGRAEEGAFDLSKKRAKLSADSVYKVCQQMKDQLHATITAAKAVVIPMLYKVRQLIFEAVEAINTRVIEAGDTASSLLEVDVTVHALTDMIPYRKVSQILSQLRTDANTSMTMQEVVFRSQQVLAISNTVMTVADFNNFEPLTALEAKFSVKTDALFLLFDASALRKSIGTAKVMMQRDISECTDRYNTLKTSYDKLVLSQATGSTTGSTACLKTLNHTMNECKVGLDLLCCLSCCTMQARHWQLLSDSSLSKCDMYLKDTDSMMVVDVRSDMAIGRLSELPLAELLGKKLDRQLEAIHSIAASALIANEATAIIDDVDAMVYNLNFVVSPITDWINISDQSPDVGLGSGPGEPMYQVSNISHINIVLSYCDSVMSFLANVLLNTHEAALSTVLKTKLLLVKKLSSFANSVHDMHVMWMQTFHYAQYADAIEMDKECMRLYALVCVDLKLLQSVMQLKGCNVYKSYTAISDYHFKVDGMLHTLQSTAEMMNNNTLSLTADCPRLLLLTGNKVNLLYRSIKLGVQDAMLCFDVCMRELIVGVGSLIFDHSSADSTKVMCVGFNSVDFIESVVFRDPIDVSLQLEFINAFDMQLRRVLIFYSDELSHCRINEFRALLHNASVDAVVNSIRSIMRLRLNLLLASLDKRIPNQVYILMNYSWFYEDVWSSLGLLHGAWLITRPDLSKEALAACWIKSLNILLSECQYNIVVLQHAIQSTFSVHPNISSRKLQKLFALLLSQEITFIHVLEDLLRSASINSAVAYWMGRYKVEFIYKIDDRPMMKSPFNISIGLFNIPYGLEYSGSTPYIVSDFQFEMVLHKLLASSLACKPLSIVNNTSTGDTELYMRSSMELKVSSKDVALSLGRMYISCTNFDDETSINFFLTRLIALDAIGSFSFAHMSDIAAFQRFLNAYGRHHAALVRDDCSVLFDHLKCPSIAGTLGRLTDARTCRKKRCFDYLGHMISNNKHMNIMVIGSVDSEDNASLDCLSRSIFDSILVDAIHPLDTVGTMLTGEGFAYGIEMQVMIQTIVQAIRASHSWIEQVLVQILSSRSLKHLVCHAGISIRIIRGCVAQPLVDLDALLAEVECIIGCLWESILHASGEHYGHFALRTFQMDFMSIVQTSLQATVNLYRASTAVSVPPLTLDNGYIIPQRMRNCLRVAAAKLSYKIDNPFITACASLWTTLSSTFTAISVIHGSNGGGKSAVRKTVLEAMGTSSDVFCIDFVPFLKVRAARTICQYMLLWHNRAVSVSRSNCRGNFNLTRIRYDTAYAADRTNTMSSIFYHTSMSTASFIGYYDTHSKWVDGCLLRKLHAIDNSSLLYSGVVDIPITNHIIVLDGPIVGNIEKLLFSLSTLDGSCRNCLTFPTGEIYMIPTNLRILVETSDMTHSSPSMVQFHNTSVTADPKCSYKKIIRAWLSHLMRKFNLYPIWNQALRELQRLLLKTSFLLDLLAVQEDATAAVTLSKICRFVKYADELIDQCHLYIVTESQLSNVRGRELLLKRLKLSIVYASIWGLGGSLQTHRAFFDSRMRDIVFIHIGSAVEFPESHTVFDLLLHLQDAKLYVYNSDGDTDSTSIGSSVTASYHRRYYSNASSSYALYIQTASTMALEDAIRLQLASGGCSVVYGGSLGKTYMINKILYDVSRNVKNPYNIDVDFVGNNRVKSLDAFAKIRNNLKQQWVGRQKKLDTLSQKEYWESAYGYHNDSRLSHIKEDFDSGSVHALCTSLRSSTTAEELRSWIIQELSTESKVVLGTPCNSYAVAFIDDVHICAANTRENSCAALLKGLVDGVMPYEDRSRTDMFRPSLHISSESVAREVGMDSFVLRRIGVIAAATGGMNELAHNELICSIGKSVCTYYFPASSTDDLHASLIAGINACLATSIKNNSVAGGYKKEINDLCSITMVMVGNIVSESDALVTVALERAYRTMIVISISVINKFCQGLRGDGIALNEAGMLLKCFVREWKINFIDQLPEGLQRSIIVSHLADELDSIDVKRLNVSSRGLATIVKGLNSDCNFVSVSKGLLVGDQLSERVVPIEICPSDASIHSAVSLVVDISDPSIFGSADVNHMLYQEAFLMILRVAHRISSSSANRHLILSGFFSNSSLNLLHIAAKLAKYTNTCTYNVNAYTNRSEHLRAFLKECIMKVAGLTVSVSASTVRMTHNVQQEQTVLVIVNGANELSEDEKRLIIRLVDLGDPCFVFDQQDMSDIYSAIFSNRSSSITGNTYRSVKDYLAVCVKDRLTVALNVAVSRSVHLCKQQMPLQLLLQCSLIGPTIHKHFISLWHGVDNYKVIEDIAAGSFNAVMSAATDDQDLVSTILPLRVCDHSVYDYSDDEDTDEDATASISTSIYRIKFVSRSVFHSHATNACGFIHQLGTMRSLSCFSDISQQSVVTYQESLHKEMLDEVREIYAYVMSVPAPCDALILSEPMLHDGPQRIAELGAIVLHKLIAQGSKALGARKVVLQQLQHAISESFKVLDTIDSLRSKVTGYVSNLNSAYASLTSELAAIHEYLDESDKAFQTSTEHESCLMAYEDYLSYNAEAASLKVSYDDAFAGHRIKLYSINPSEWASMASVYKHPVVDRECIDLLKAVMLLMKYTPKDSRGRVVNDDNMLCRLGAALLTKEDFSSHLASSSLSALTNSQVHSFKVLTAGVIHELRDFPPEQYDGHDKSCLVYESLKRFCLMCEAHYCFQQKAAAVSNASQGLLDTYKQMQSISEGMLHAKNIDVLNRKSKKTEELLLVKQALSTNHDRLRKLDQMQLNHDEIHRICKDYEQYISTELSIVTNSIKLFVPDCVVAVAVLLRAGFLPEQLRQECMDAFRNCLHLHFKSTSDTPYVIGTLSDNQQYREWTSKRSANIPRDPASINSISLLYLSPVFTFIVDPDNTADRMIIDSAPEGCDVVDVTGGKFTLSFLKSYLTNKRGSCSNASSVDKPTILLVKDLQVGVSDDLISLLNSNLVSIGGCLMAYVKQSTSIDGDIEAVNLGNLRLYLLSTKGPSMDSNNAAHPLPTTCYSNITVIQWITYSCNSSRVLESSPLAYANGKDYVSDNLLSHELANLLSASIAPNLKWELSCISCDILKLTAMAYKRQSDEMLKIYDLVSMHQQEASKIFEMHDLLLFQPGVVLGIASMVDVTVLLQETTVYVTKVAKYIAALEKQENALIRSTASLSDVFLMASTFIKVLGTCVASHMIPPMAIAPVELFKGSFAEKTLRAARLFPYMRVAFTKRLGVATLNAICMPLRAYFLKAAVDYIENSIMPGFEWYVKFTLMVSMWAQSSTFNLSEVRALSMLFNDVSSVPASMYGSNISLSGRSSRKVNLNRQNIIKKAVPKGGSMTSAVPSRLPSDCEKLNGLLINRQSQRWTVREGGCDSRSVSVLGAFPSLRCDGEQISCKSMLFKPQPRVGDPFAVEWMWLSGVNTFTYVGHIGALEAMGGSSKVVGAIAEMLPSSAKKHIDYDFKQLQSKHHTLHSKGDVASASKESGTSPRAYIKGSFFPVSHTVSKLAVTYSKHILHRAKFVYDQCAVTDNPVSTDAAAVVANGRMSLLKDHALPLSADGRCKHLIDSICRQLHKIRKAKGALSDCLEVTQSYTIAANTAAVDTDSNRPTIDHLIEGDRSKQLAHTLENHSSFSAVFKGMVAAMTDRIETFIEWKTVLLKVSSMAIPVDVKMDALEDILIAVIPPVFAVKRVDESSSDGCWVKGKELSVTQSMLLSEVVAPGSSQAILRIYFHLICKFLEGNGTIVSHADEGISASEKCSTSNDGNASSIGDVEDGDADDDEGGGVSDGEIGKSDEDRDGSETSVAANDDVLPVFKEDDLLQQMLPDTNCWTKLRLSIVRNATDAKARGIGIGIARGRASALRADSSGVRRLMHRDYNNWESVIYAKAVETASCKYSYTTHIRQCIQDATYLIMLKGNNVNNCSVSRLHQHIHNICSYNRRHFTSSFVSPYDETTLTVANIEAVRDSRPWSIKLIDATSFCNVSNNPILQTVLSARIQQCKEHIGLANVSSSDAGTIKSKWGNGARKATLYRDTLILITRQPRRGDVMPSAPFSTHNYIWVPFTCFDAINSHNRNEATPSTLRMRFNSLSLNNSVGILYEELERVYAFTLISFKMLKDVCKGTVSSFDHIRKFELRTVTTIITVYQILLLYFHPSKSLPCIELIDVSIWQLGVLLSNIKAITDAATKYADRNTHSIYAMESEAYFTDAVSSLYECLYVMPSSKMPRTTSGNSSKKMQMASVDRFSRYHNVNFHSAVTGKFDESARAICTEWIQEIIGILLASITLCLHKRDDEVLQYVDCKIHRLLVHPINATFSLKLGDMTIKEILYAMILWILDESAIFKQSKKINASSILIKLKVRAKSKTSRLKIDI